MLQLEVNGSSFCVGEAIGEAFHPYIKEYIQYRYDQMRTEFDRLGVCFNRSYYDTISESLLDYGKKNSPDEFLELSGIAFSSGVTQKDILFAAGYTDIFDILSLPAGTDHRSMIDNNAECSTFVYTSLNQVFCGQNWDMDEGSSKRICFLRKSYSDGKVIQGLSTVIGLIHIGMNNDGDFVGTANLSSVRNSADGLVFPLTIQHLLRQGIHSNSLDWLRKCSKAGAHYFYFMDSGHKSFAAECDGAHTHIWEINSSYAHTNHFQEDCFANYAINYSSDSMLRYDFMQHTLLNDVSDIKSLKKMLANHGNMVCKHSKPNGLSKTCASVVFDAMTLEMHVCDSSPCNGNWRIYRAKE